MLLDEVVLALAINPGERHVDATFGAGGYTRALLSHGARVFAFDRDPDAIAAGREMEAASGGALTLCYTLGGHAVPQSRPGGQWRRRPAVP